MYESLDWKPMQAYGRIHKNKTESGYLPQYNDGGRDYVEDVYIVDKKNKSNMFFIVEDKHTLVNALTMQAKVKIVFMLDLEKVFPSSSERKDAFAQKQVFELLEPRSQFNITGMETGLETVLKGFNVESINNADIQPYHIFAAVGTINYIINKC